MRAGRRVAKHLGQVDVAALRVVARRFVSSRTGDIDTSIGLQLELKGLSSVGVDNIAFLREAIRGYSALPSEARP